MAVAVMVVLVSATVALTYFDEGNIKGILQIAGFVLTAIFFLTYGSRTIRAHRYFKIEDTDKKQPLKEADEKQP